MSKPNNLKIKNRTGYTWVTLPDPLTMENCLQIERDILTEIERGSKRIVLDCFNTNHIYSSGIALLIRLKKLIGDAKGFLCIVNASSGCRELLETTQLDRIIPIYATDTEFEISHDDVWARKLSEKKIGFVSVSQIENKVCRINISGQMTESQDISRFGPSVYHKGIKHYLFDLTGLETIDNSGLHLLDSVLSEINNHNGVCAAYGVSESIIKLFKLMSIDKCLSCYKKESAALKALLKK